MVEAKQNRERVDGQDDEDQQAGTVRDGAGDHSPVPTAQYIT